MQVPKFLYFVLMFFFGIAFISSVNAAVKDDAGHFFMVSELDYLQAVPVVLSATRLSQPVDSAPAAVTVISREMIGASGAQEISDLLRLVPGFQVGYFTGTSVSMTFHGFSGNYGRRLQVLIDGRSVYMPMLSTVEWLSLPIDISDVEKVEVIRSSNTPVFGANSFKGVINIITRKPFQDIGSHLEVTVGSHDLGVSKNLFENRKWKTTTDTLTSKKTVARFADVVNDFDYRVTVSYQEDEGFDDIEDNKELTLLRFSGGYKINSIDKLDLQWGVRSGEMDGFASGKVDDPHRIKTVASSYQSLTWTRAKNSENELNIRFYHNHYAQNDEYTVVPSSIKMGVYYGIAERFDFEAQYIQRLLPNLRSVTSGGARLDRLKSRYLLAKEGYESDRSARVATNLEWYITESTVLNSGVMVERNEQIGTYYSPRLALNTKLSNSHVIRMSATRALRTPSILENHLYLGCCIIEGSPPQLLLHLSEKNLKAEKLDLVEFGYIYLSRRSGISFDSKISWEKISDGILEATDEPGSNSPWVWGNNTSAEVYGLESQMKIELGSSNFLHLAHSYLEGDADYHKYRTSENNIVDISDTIPSHSFSLLASYQVTSNLNWSFSYFRMSKIKWLQDGSRLPAQDRFDTKLSWRNNISYDRRIAVSLVLQNLFGDYAEVQHETIFEQRGFFSVSFDW